MSKIFKLNLSKYNSYENLPTEIESIIVQDLIIMNGNVRQVSKYFSLDEEITTKIYIKYFQHINELIDEKEKQLNDKNNVIVDQAIDLYKNHMTEITNHMEKKDDKMLSYNSVRAINSILANTLKLKEHKEKQYDNQLKSLNDMILKSKDVQIKENMTTKVSDAIDKYSNIKSFSEQMKDLTDFDDIPDDDPEV